MINIAWEGLSNEGNHAASLLKMFYQDNLRTCLIFNETMCNSIRLATYYTLFFNIAYDCRSASVIFLYLNMKQSRPYLEFIWFLVDQLQVTVQQVIVDVQWIVYFFCALQIRKIQWNIHRDKKMRHLVPKHDIYLSLNLETIIALCCQVPQIMFIALKWFLEK